MNKSEVAKLKMIAWLALIIAFVALVLAGIVYQKQTALRPLNLGGQVDVSETLKERQAVAASQTALEDLRKGIANGTIQLSQVPATLTQIRNDLAVAFQNANAQSKAYWLVLDADFAKIGGSLRSGTRGVLDGLDAVILSLKRALQ